MLGLGNGRLRFSHLWVLLLAAGLSIAEEPAPAEPRTILTYGERLELSDGQRTEVQRILDEFTKACEPLDQQVLKLDRGIEHLVAWEGGLEVIWGEMDEECEVIARRGLLAAMASREIVQTLTEAQRATWRETRLDEDLTYDTYDGPIWPPEQPNAANDGEAEAAPPPHSLCRTLLGGHREDPLNLTDQQLVEIRKLLGDLGKMLKVTQARLILLGAEVEEWIESGGEPPALQAMVSKEARLRAEARFKDIQTSRKVSRVLSEAQLAAWKKIGHEQRPKDPGPSPAPHDGGK